MPANPTTVQDIEAAVEGFAVLLETTVAAFAKNAVSVAHLTSITGIINTALGALAAAATTIAGAV
jgi:hypothetical protein